MHSTAGHLPALEYTKVNENWHLYYTGDLLFFGRTQQEVMGKARRYPGENCVQGQSQQDEALNDSDKSLVGCAC